MSGNLNVNNEENTIKKLKEMMPKSDEVETSNNEKSEHGFSFQPKEKVIIAWEAVEKEHYPRSAKWYVGVILMMIFGVVYGAFTSSITMIIVFVLMASVMILYAHNLPRLIEVFITGKGIYIDAKLYKYGQIKNFWVFDEHPVCKFGFQESKKLHRIHDILLHDVDPDIVRNTLKYFITEDVHKKEGVKSHLSRYFRL